MGTDRQTEHSAEMNPSLLETLFCADSRQQVIVEQIDNSLSVAGTIADLFGKKSIKSLSHHIPKSILGRLKYLNIKGKKL